ncbi:hypothetical protein K3553_11810 [Leisingera aquaemixtae]|uniref:Calx-beta domain-containing protein n=1 Tax=Leisingera aquaemixtae TaxID=1396826 RepID=UPI0021A2B685|nr:Calx-beta domain-containing protein [Leisingera aquaemixtae]UWQ23665.1 hypothetical protein K3553_11810 [Leisingera aquaemixtae]
MPANLFFPSRTIVVTEGDEGARTVEVTMALSSASSETVEVDLQCGVYSFSPDGAEPGVDFVPFRQTLSFAPGETERTFEVTYYGDTLYERDERFWVKMIEARGAEIDPDVNLSTQSIIIRNDDEATAPTLSFPSRTIVVTEGDEGARTVEVTMALSSASSETVEVDLQCGVYSFSPDGAEPGVDFVPFRQTLSFAPGETERTFEVTYYGDTLYERDERFWVKMIEARGAEIDPDVNLSTQSIIIRNDDEATAPTLSFPSRTIVVTEGDEGARTVEVTMALSSASSETVEVDLQCGVYSFSPDGAEPGVDFVPFRQTLSFAPGETERTFEVTYYGDTLYERDERFWVKMIEARGAEIDPDVNLSTQSIIIRNDDSRNSAPQGNLVVNGLLEQNSELSVDTSRIEDEDGIGSLNYQWLRDGVAISGATGEKYILRQGDVGAAVSVRVSYTDGRGAVETLTSEATAAVRNVNDAPVGTVLISGRAVQGRTLSASHTLDDADGLGAVFYQWQRDGEDIEGATGETYTLTGRDSGAVITVLALYTDNFGVVETVLSAPTPQVRGSIKLFGNASDNALTGGRFDDLLSGRAGDDTLRGNNGADRLLGGSGADNILGGSGRDLLKGHGGHDELAGNGGNDRLLGGGGNDRIAGGGGRDRIQGQKGADVLTGGAGRDTFVFNRGDGHDTIADFELGIDQIEIGRGASRMRQLDIEQQGDDVSVSFRNVEITVENLTVDELLGGDHFIFA